MIKINAEETIQKPLPIRAEFQLICSFHKCIKTDSNLHLSNFCSDNSVKMCFVEGSMTDAADGQVTEIIACGCYEKRKVAICTLHHMI